MPPVPSPGLHDRHQARPSRPAPDRAARIRFRRAITLLLMTLVIPGSAQLVAGNRRVGRIAMRIWMGLIAVTVLAVLVGLLWHSFVFRLAFSPFWLGVIRLALMAIAVGWAALCMDAWRLGQPLTLLQKHRVAVVGLNGFLCFSVAGALLFGAHLVGVHRTFVLTMFGDGSASPSHDGRYNVLLLGGDSGKGRWGLRPDSVTVASIDARTGQTVLFGLPRNMTNFPFPDGSVMQQQFPDGYDCGAECELNSLATWAGDNKGLFKGYDDAGIEATIEGVEGITGLEVNYWAMVNLQGFQDLVDAMGGLTLNVRDAVPIGKIGDIKGYVEPGIRKLDGFETLWFARSRAAADDYSRMARQKCVMNAMLHQLSPTTLITKYGAITKATSGLLSTDLPASEFGRFAELAMKARSMPVQTVSFVPPAINTGDPDIDKIHEMIATALGQGTDEERSGGTQGFSRGHAATTGASKGDIHSGYAANQSSDLGRAC
jgi:LCP family protein required for cell wall assembly